MSGTDIAQFTRFRTREDALAYERELDAVVDRLERVTKPTIAQADFTKGSVRYSSSTSESVARLSPSLRAASD